MISIIIYLIFLQRGGGSEADSYRPQAKRLIQKVPDVLKG
jgi:hypothetical protein